MIKFHHYSILLLVAITVILTGCNRKEPVKIGFLGCLSGRNADLGIAGLNGVTLAVEQINLAGGIKGARVELVARDDEQNAETAIRQVESLIKSGVKVIIGPMTSNMAMAVLPKINSSGTILLSPTVTSTDLTGKDDNFLRVCGDVSAYATKSARYYYEKFGKRRVAVVYDNANSSYSERWLTHFKKTFETKGGMIVGEFGFSADKNRAFLATAASALAIKPDLVLVIANTVDASSITQQLRKLKPGMAIALSEWSATERFIELTGTYSEGVHVSQFIKLEDTSAPYLAFVDEYRKRFSMTPLFSSLGGYDAARVATKALAGKGMPLKESIVSTGRFEGAQEPITIDRFGDSQRTTYLSVIRNGKYQPLE